MYIRVCPSCDKMLYLLDPDDMLRCPHCGFSLLERRGERRVSSDRDMAIEKGGRSVKVRLVDCSAGGLRIFADEPCVFDPGTEVSVRLGPVEEPRKAMTVWSKRGPGRRREYGLRFAGKREE